MFLNLSHTRLVIYNSSQELVTECYKVTKTFPSDERFLLTSQIRRAAISVMLNLAEGCSRRTQKERNRFFEIARGSVVEIDTAVGISNKLEYKTRDESETPGQLLIKKFKLLSGMIKPCEAA